MKKEPLVPKEIDRRHQRHVRRFHKPVPGNLAHAEGHALTMVVTTTFRCECGCKLSRKAGR